MDLTYQQKIDQYKNGKGHLLIPTPQIEGLSPFHRVVFEEVYLDPRPHPVGEDVYKGTESGFGNDKKQYFRLLGKALERLSVCAGIKWHLDLTRIVTVTKDYVMAEAVGGITKPDGQIAYLKASYDIDLVALRDDVKKGHMSKRTNSTNKNKTEAEFNEYVEYCTDRDFRQKRKFKLQLAESGAKYRLVRKLLGIREYTHQELLLPFVAVRIVFNPDMNDPRVKDMLIEAYMRSTMGIFGPSASTPQIPMMKNVSPQEDIVDVDTHDDAIHEVIEPLHDEIPPDAALQSESISDADKLDILCTEFEEMTKKEKIERIHKLVVEKKFGATKTPIEKMNDTTLKQFFAHLINMK